jgi:hypothetical protein
MLSRLRSLAAISVTPHGPDFGPVTRFRYVDKLDDSSKNTECQEMFFCLRSVSMGRSSTFPGYEPGSHRAASPNRNLTR